MIARSLERAGLCMIFVAPTNANLTD